MGSGLSSVQNVLAEDSGGRQNFMTSFMLAEVLKYQYLVQTGKKGVWNLLAGEGMLNEFVHNTVAHPFSVAAKKPV